MPKQRLKAKGIVLTIVAVLASLWFFNFINLNFLPQALSAPPQCTEPEIEAGIDMLKNQDVSAFDLLVQCQSKSVLPLTQVLIYTEEENVELIAIAILAQIGSQASAAIPVLDTLLQEPNTDVRIATVYALQEIGKDAVPSLITALKDKDYNVSYRANNAIVKIGKSAVPALIEILKNENEIARYEVERILAVIGKDAVPELIKFLKNSALVDNSIINKQSEQTLLNSSELIPLLNNSNNSSNGVISAFELLGQIGEDAKEAVPTLIVALKDKDIDVRLWAARALGEIKAKEAIPDLIIALRDKDKDKDVRLWAARALGEIKAKEAVPDLIIALRDKDKDVRLSAAMALGEIKAKEAVPDLIIAIIDEDNYYNLGAVEALGKIKAKEAVPDLIGVFINTFNKKYMFRDFFWYTYNEVINAIINIGKDAVPALTVLLKNSNPDIKLEAIKILVKIGKEAIPAIIESLQDNDATTKLSASAIVSMLDIGVDSKYVVPILIANLEDEHINPCYNKNEFINILEKIGAPAIPYLIAAFKEENWGIRYWTSTALKRIIVAAKKDISSEKIVSKIKEVFLDETEYIETRSLALESLEAIASQESISVINNYKEIANAIQNRIYREKERYRTYQRGASGGLVCQGGQIISVRAATAASISSKTPVACQIPLIRTILKWKCS